MVAPAMSADGLPEQLMTRGEVIRLLRISRCTSYRLERIGALRPVRLSEKIVRFRAGDVRRLIGETEGEADANN